MTGEIFTTGNPIYAGFTIAAIVLIGIEMFQGRQRKGIHGLAWWTLGGLTLLNLLALLYFWIDRISMQLPATEFEQSAVMLLQHMMRGESLYQTWGDASPLTIPPFYHLISMPFAILFGANVGTLRLVAVLGIVASGLLVFRSITEKTGSNWWGMVALGLFATAVSMMDAYMGTVSPDPWLLCCALLGTYLLDRNRSETDVTLGILVLSNGVWFRQAGLIFLIGGLAYLTWQRGWAASARYWLTGVGFTLIAWVTIGPLLFGSEFINFTLFAPLTELHFSINGLLHYGVFVTGTYPLLALASTMLVIAGLLWHRSLFDIWQAQFIAAVLLGMLTTLFVQTSISMLSLTGVWFIVIGLQALYRWSHELVYAQKYQLHIAAMFASFLVVFRA